MEPTETLGTVRVFQLHLQIAKSLQNALKESREAEEPERKQLNDYTEKFMSARIAQVVTGFNAAGTPTP